MTTFTRSECNFINFFYFIPSNCINTKTNTSVFSITDNKNMKNDIKKFVKINKISIFYT